MEQFTLSAPVSFDGETTEHIELDFTKVNGKAIADCAKRVRKAAGAGEIILAVETEPDFLIMLAAYASSKPVAFFENLPGPDYMSIMTTVRNFLFSGQ